MIKRFAYLVVAGAFLAFFAWITPQAIVAAEWCGNDVQAGALMLVAACTTFLTLMSAIIGVVLFCKG